MPYYPKSQILTNQKTNGKEYILSTTGELYKGDFYKLSSGVIFTGKNPQNGPNIQLFPIPPSSPDSLYNTPSDPFESDISPYVAEQDKGFYRTTVNPTYLNLDLNFKSRKRPSLFNPVLTLKSKKLGIFERHFCKKNNELKYFEISQETFNLLNSNSNSDKLCILQ